MTGIVFWLIILFLWIISLQIQVADLSNKIDNGNAKDTKIRNSEKETNSEIIQDSHNIEHNTEIKNQYDKTIFSEESKTNFDFETAFLGNIFNKIGAIALIIGIGIFVKLISPFLIFTPAIKILLGYIAGIVILFFGYKMKDEKLKNYKEVLMGTGVSALFITTYCASAFYNLFNNITSTIIATLILAGVYFIADKQKTVSMITIALIAGYLNPFLITSDVKPEFLFGYYILVNLLSCIYVHKNPEKSIINFVNLCATFVFLASAIFKDISNVNIIYPLLLWLLYLVYDVIRKNKGTDTNDKNNILNWLNYAVLALFTTMIFNNEKSYIGYLILSVGIIYAGLVIKFFDKKSEIYKPYMYSGILCVFLSTFFLSDGILRIFLWSLESAVLSYAGFRFNLSLLGNWALGYIISAVTGLFFIDNVVYSQDLIKYIPVWNIRTLSFIFPIASGYFSYNVLKQSENLQAKKISEIFRFTALSLIYLYITFEVNNFIMKFRNGEIDKEFITAMLVSIIGFKYALQARRIYNSNNLNMFNIASHIIGSISLLILLFGGYSYYPENSFIPVFNIRFATYIVGIVTAYMFGKWTKNDAFKYLTAILGFMLIHVETSDFVDLHANWDYLVTVSWLIYAGIITLCGIFKNIKYLKFTGIWISIIAISRIFIFDLADTDIIYKLVAFLTLGTILMLVSYYYNKHSN